MAAAETLFLSLLGPALAALDARPAAKASAGPLTPGTASGDSLNIEGAAADKRPDVEDPEPAGSRTPFHAAGPRSDAVAENAASIARDASRPAGTTHVERIETVRRPGNGEVRVDLFSEELGRVTIRVVLRGETVSAIVAPARADAALPLGLEVAAVRAALAQAGIAVGTWAVVAPKGRGGSHAAGSDEAGEERIARGLPAGAESVGGRRRRKRFDFVV